MRTVGQRAEVGIATALLALVMAALTILALLAPAARAAPHVLVVGDSLEELTSPHLAKLLPGVRLTINAVGGYNSYQIFDLFQESYEPSQRVVVFDAGTNDNPGYPQILAGNLARALLRYRGFRQQGFEVVAVVDSDPQKVGQQFGGLTIESSDRLAE